MSKRLGLLFLLVLAAGALVWFSRERSEKKDSGVIPKHEISDDPPTVMSSESAGKDLEAPRESSRHSAGEVERHQAEERRLSDLKRAVRDQEDKVEERRKLLATIVRTKGTLYKGPDADYSAGAVDPGHAIKNALDAQDYVDVKRDFETDQRLLEELKLKLKGEQMKSSVGGE